MIRTATQWLDILLHCQVKPAIAADWAEVFARVVGEGTFSQGDAELDDFLGQILHESAGLTQFTENLRYSAERLCQVWPRRFPALQDARPYAYNPEALANKVYGGRMGNVALGDGWKYRGRSPIQLTGKDNYAHVGALMGEDLVANPELLSQPDFALKAAIFWWEDRIPDSMIGDPEKVTQRVNGGLIGLVDRVHLTALASAAIDQAIDRAGPPATSDSSMLPKALEEQVRLLTNVAGVPEHVGTKLIRGDDDGGVGELPVVKIVIEVDHTSPAPLRRSNPD